MCVVSHSVDVPRILDCFTHKKFPTDICITLEMYEVMFQTHYLTSEPCWSKCESLFRWGIWSSEKWGKSTQIWWPVDGSTQLLTPKAVFFAPVQGKFCLLYSHHFALVTCSVRSYFSIMERAVLFYATEHTNCKGRFWHQGGDCLRRLGTPEWCVYMPSTVVQII